MNRFEKLETPWNRQGSGNPMQDAFDTGISVFRNETDTQPLPLTLGRWIELTRTRNNHTERVIRFRETGDSRIKSGLPRATVGAVCDGGRRLENVLHRTGWIAIDADAGDNELKGVELRALIARVDCVAYVGLSASGKGAWGLVKISNPQRQAGHFEQLRADFAAIGVTLDASKGKNPNDCRSISYDPDGIYRRGFVTYTRLPMPKQKPRPRPPLIASRRGANAYVEAALNAELDELSRTPEGGRNQRLFVAAASLGGLVGAGLLDEDVVADHLHAVAVGIGLDPREAARAIRSGLRATGRRSARLLDSEIHLNSGANAECANEGWEVSVDARHCLACCNTYRNQRRRVGRSSIYRGCYGVFSRPILARSLRVTDVLGRTVVTMRLRRNPILGQTMSPERDREIP